ncbi:hypothetical protein [Paractinoplanes toevensis]|uniref:Uncharacterized protein n=1 Tax=Paractinoplanes toevensis TaxID=571911 RepID=A0A919WCD3_9ACTN|nr:hypothetical protein [Actinoplanes toevensis]GIM97657.1 hypothetical protein Ato02nite_094500 [Actinoplanes toevensis]
MAIVLDRWAVKQDRVLSPRAGLATPLRPACRRLRGLMEMSFGTGQVTVALEQVREVVMCVRIAELGAGAVGSFRGLLSACDRIWGDGVHHLHASVAARPTVPWAGGVQVSVPRVVAEQRGELSGEAVEV